MLKIFFKILKTLILILVVGFLSFFAYTKFTDEKVTFIPRADGTQMPIVAFPLEEGKSKGLIIISHGAGGSEQDLKYLSHALKDDYFVVVAGHQEHELIAMLYSLLIKKNYLNDKNSVANDPKTYQSREMDIDAILKWVPDYVKNGKKILVGYSRGSRVVMTEAGAHNTMGIEAKDRFDAYIALSPVGQGLMFPKDAWKDIKKPILMLTGTMDDFGLENGWQSRREPFDNMTGGCKWLGVIDGASHLNFGGLGFAKVTKELTIKVTREFLRNLELKTCKKPEVDKRMTLEIKE